MLYVSVSILLRVSTIVRSSQDLSLPPKSKPQAYLYSSLELGASEEEQIVPVAGGLEYRYLCGGSGSLLVTPLIISQ